MNTSVLVEKLLRLDEEILIDLLGLDSELLVERFADIIEDKYEYLVGELIDG